MNRYVLASLSLALLVGSAACTRPGDRAATGDCPADEECSDWTPDGLYFVGATHSDLGFETGVPTTALGGTQTIRVLTSADPDGPEYSLGYDAVSMRPDVLEITGATGASIGVAGLESGESRLRLLQPDTELLLDRTLLSVRAIESIELVPAQLFIAEAPESWAVWSGATLEIVARLTGAGGGRVVDETTTFAGPDVARPLAWDAFELAAGPAGLSGVTVDAGDLSVDLDIAVVDSLDSIEPYATSTSELEVGQTRTYCFEPLSGDATVFGLVTMFTLAGGVAAEDASDTLFGPCVAVSGVSEGAATITANAEGVNGVLDLVVVPETGTGGTSMPLVRGGSAAPGERAASL